MCVDFAAHLPAEGSGQGQICGDWRERPLRLEIRKARRREIAARLFRFGLGQEPKILARIGMLLLAFGEQG